MNYDELNIKAWSMEIRKNQMLYPDERVVACLAKNFGNIKGNNDKKALDIGFGSGRHLKLLLDYGFDVYGVDYSMDSVKTAENILGGFKDRINIRKADLGDNLYSNEFFDFIICYGVIFLRQTDDMVSDLQKIYALLKIGGKLIVNFRTKEDHNYAKGKQINENTYLLNETAGEYKNMLYTFLDLEQAEKMLINAGFKIENRERIDFWKNNLKQHHSWWIFTVRKG